MSETTRDFATTAVSPWYRSLNRTQWKALLASNLGWTFDGFEVFALILTGHNTAMITVTMAQFVTELGTQWNLMSAMAVLAMGPAVLVTLFAQRYVIRGLRI